MQNILLIFQRHQTLFLLTQKIIKLTLTKGIQQLVPKSGTFLIFWLGEIGCEEIFFTNWSKEALHQKRKKQPLLAIAPLPPLFHPSLVNAILI